MVVITFEMQKNDKRNQRVFMYTSDNILLNPVSIWALTIQRFWGIPGASETHKSFKVSRQ